MLDDEMLRFWAKVRPNDATGCWEWTSTRIGHGYGYFRLRVPRRQEYAHRIAYTLAYGPIPRGMVVCHRCDNPPCLNPDHLFLGDQLANVRDMIAKGRQPTIVLKAHCKRGHPFDEANTYRVGRIRHCRACRREQKRRQTFTMFTRGQ